MRLVALTIAAALGITMLGAGSHVAYAAPEIETNEKAKTVKIQPGDSLTAIATAHGSTAQRIYDANPSIENPDLIFPGNDLKIPSKNDKLEPRPFPVATPAATLAEPQYQAPVPSRSVTTVAAAPVANGSVWDQLAQCESGGNWAINTGNGYYGGLQFSLSSWQAVGGSGLPSNASREEQIMRGQILQARQGWGAWPACTAKLGIR